MAPLARSTSRFASHTEAVELARAEYALSTHIILRLWFSQYCDISRNVLTALEMPADQIACYLVAVNAVALCRETVIVERIQWGFPGNTLIDITDGTAAMEVSGDTLNDIELAQSVATHLSLYLQDKLGRGETIHRLRRAIIAVSQFALVHGMMPAELVLNPAWHSSAIAATTTKADFLRQNEVLTKNLLQVQWVCQSKIPAANIDHYVANCLRALAANLWC